MPVPRRMLTALVAAAGLSLACALPAQAQTQQEGLVNVAVEDVIVQAPIAVAANVCDVAVAALAQVRDAAAACEATATSTASARPGPDRPTQQDGLVNVLVDDVLIQAPISVAANICDVTVAVLADVVDEAQACDATAESIATPARGPGGGAGGGGAGGIFLPIDIDLTGLLNLGDSPPTPIVPLDDNTADDGGLGDVVTGALPV